MKIYDIIKTELKKQEEQSNILEIYKTGSQIFIPNPKDLDYVVICDDYKQRRRKTVVEDGGKKYDIIIMDTKAVDAQLDFNDNEYIHYKIKLFNYLFLIRETVFGHYELSWDMLAHEKEYVDYLKMHHSQTLAKAKTKWRLGKSYVHYYIILKIFENKKVELTKEMIEDTKLLYARNETCVPIIDWVESKISV